MSPRSRAGFTLAELLVSMLMSGFLFVSLAALYSAGIRYQVRTFDRTAVGNRALIAQRTIQANVSQATLIDVDTLPIGGTGNTLFVGINVYPGNQSASAGGPAVQPPLLNFGGLGARYALFCLTPAVSGASAVCPPGFGHPNPATARRCLVYYGGPWPIPNPAIGCGDAAPAGHIREVLAGPVETSAAAPFGGAVFFRPRNNLVLVNLLVRRDPDLARSVPELRFAILSDLRARLSID